MVAPRLCKAAIVGIAAMLMIASTGCGDDDDDEADASVAGTYECGLEGEPTREVWELSEDQTLLVSPKDSEAEPEEGTWSMEDGQVIIDFSGANNDPFNVEDGRLVFAGPEGSGGLWVCTRQT